MRMQTVYIDRDCTVEEAERVVCEAIELMNVERKKRNTNKTVAPVVISQEEIELTAKYEPVLKKMEDAKESCCELKRKLNRKLFNTDKLVCASYYNEKYDKIINLYDTLDKKERPLKIKYYEKLYMIQNNGETTDKFKHDIVPQSIDYGNKWEMYNKHSDTYYKSIPANKKIHERLYKKVIYELLTTPMFVNKKVWNNHFEVMRDFHTHIYHKGKQSMWFFEKLPRFTLPYGAGFNGYKRGTIELAKITW